MTLLAFAVSATIAGAAVMRWRYGLFSITKLNVLQIMFLSHVFVQLIPSYIIAMDPTNRAAETYLTYCIITTILIPLGGMLADVCLQVRSKTTFYRLPIDDSFTSRRKFANFFAAYLAFCGLIFFSYIVQLPTIPIYDLVFGLSGPSDHQLARREATTVGFVYGVALRFFMPVLFLVALLARSYLVNRALRRAAFLAILIALAFNAWPGGKTPVATLLLMGALMFLIRSSEEIHCKSLEQRESAAKQQRKSRKRAVRLAIGLLVLVVLYPIGVFLMLPAGQLGIGYILESVFFRIFFKPAEATYVAFEMFRHGGYTHFADINKLASMLGLSYVPLSREVAVYRGLGEFTNAPPAAIGTFYAQGGGVVVILGVILASFMFKLTENLLRQAVRKTPLTIALYVVLIFAAFRFSWANFHSMIMSEVFLPMIFVWMFWLAFGRTSMRR